MGYWNIYTAQKETHSYFYPYHIQWDISTAEHPLFCFTYIAFRSGHVWSSFNYDCIIVIEWFLYDLSEIRA